MFRTNSTRSSSASSSSTTAYWTLRRSEIRDGLFECLSRTLFKSINGHKSNNIFYNFRIYHYLILFNNLSYQIIGFPMSQDVKPVGKNCELILKELGIQEYAIGKTKVSFIRHLTTFLVNYSFYHTVIDLISKIFEINI